MISDTVLLAYIDEIMRIYDTNRSGTIERHQADYFFNDLFLRLGSNRTFTHNEVSALFRAADSSHDGRLDRLEVLRITRALFQRVGYANIVTTYIAPPANYVYRYFMILRPAYYASSPAYYRPAAQYYTTSPGYSTQYVTGPSYGYSTGYSVPSSYGYSAGYTVPSTYGYSTGSVGSVGSVGYTVPGVTVPSYQSPLVYSAAPRYGSQVYY